MHKCRMKASQEIYVNTGVTAWNKSQSEEGIYENELKLPKKKHNREPTNSGHNTAWSRCYKVTAACLLLLCVLLLAAVTVLWVKFNNLNKENNQLQTSYNNLTLDRDQIQFSYNKLTQENNQLQTSYNNLAIQRDQIQSRCNELTQENNQLQINCKKLNLEANLIQPETLILNSVLVKLGWRLFGSSIYAISTETKSWNDTKQDCIRRGADLVIINSIEEEEFINENFGSTDVWLGLTNFRIEKELRRVNSLPQNIRLWRFGNFQNYRQAQYCFGKHLYSISDPLPNSFHESIREPNTDPIFESSPGPTYNAIPDSTPDPQSSRLDFKKSSDFYCKVTVVGICRMKLNS